jgi:hypothetical protein
LADQQHLHQAIRRVVESTAASFRAQAQLNIRKGGSMLIKKVWMCWQTLSKG